MATSRAANIAEKVLKDENEAAPIQDLSNPAKDAQKFGDPSGQTMKALIWLGKKEVTVGEYIRVAVAHLIYDCCSGICIKYMYITQLLIVSIIFIAEVPKPKIIEDQDVLVKVTGSTICGSDLHLYHGTFLFA